MPAKLSQAALKSNLRSLRGWSYDGQRAIQKRFKFKDHVTAMGFVNRVALVAEALNHHPELKIVYSTVDIALSTHDAGGVTRKDVDLARKIEQYR